MLALEVKDRPLYCMWAPSTTPATIEPGVTPTPWDVASIAWHHQQPNLYRTAAICPTLACWSPMESSSTDSWPSSSDLSPVSAPPKAAPPASLSHELDTEDGLGWGKRKGIPTSHDTHSISSENAVGWLRRQLVSALG